MKSESAEGVYLFCLGRSGLVPAIEAKGVDGHNPLFLYSFLDVVAVASAARLEEFCGPAAESRMQDLSWVGSRACRHEEVVEKVMRHSPVLPVRFGTIFSSLESLQEVLRKHRPAICRFLDWVADKEEWAVKGLLDKTKAEARLLSSTLAARAESLASSSPGMRYFKEKQIRGSVEKELKGWLKRICRAVGDDLANHASDSRERKVLPSDNEGVDMVLNWAFLVPRNGTPDFRARIERANAEHSQEGLAFEVSGPWPPYSFCPCLEGEARE